MATRLIGCALELMLLSVFDNWFTQDDYVMRGVGKKIGPKAKVRVWPVGGGAHRGRQRDFFEIGVFLNPQNQVT